MEFPADLQQLEAMLSYLRSEAQRIGLSDEKIYRIEIATEEALVNIISYAFPEGQKGKLTLECHFEKARFEVLITDAGQPFNPIEADIQVDIDQPIEQRKIGGLGIYMIRKLVDEVSYQRIDGKNTLRIVIIP